MPNCSQIGSEMAILAYLTNLYDQFVWPINQPLTIVSMSVTHHFSNLEPIEISIPNFSQIGGEMTIPPSIPSFIDGRPIRSSINDWPIHSWWPFFPFGPVFPFLTFFPFFCRQLYQYQWITVNHTQLKPIWTWSILN